MMWDRRLDPCVIYGVVLPSLEGLLLRYPSSRVASQVDGPDVFGQARAIIMHCLRREEVRTLVSQAGKSVRDHPKYIA
jgi:hypothetical protein